jgi:hypothetical protein
MTRAILLSIAIVVLLVDGFVYGLWTDRWGNGHAVEQAVERLDRVPMSMGDWEGQSLELGARQAEQAGFAGYWLRRYERRQDGMVVQVMLACGRPGPLCVHTPTVCYAGAGYAQSEAPVKHKAAAREDAPPPELWKAKFSKPDALVPFNLRVFYAWRASQGWQAAQNPRWQFAGQPVLFKMYVTHVIAGSDEKREDAACTEFINLLLPELEKTLAAP